MNNNKEKCDILCFGDSLTYGYYDMGSGCHPYSDQLYKLLSERYDNVNIKINTIGIPGARAVTMLEGLLADKLSEHKEKYDIVIILAGTNDLATGAKPNKVIDALKYMHKISIKHGAQCVALTVPDHMQERMWQGKLQKTKQKVNDYLLKKCIGNKQIPKLKGNKRITDKPMVIDIAKAVPFFDITEELRFKRWDDGLHFTPSGYDEIGEFIANQMFPYMDQIYKS